MIEIFCTDWVRIEIDAAEVDDPCQLSSLSNDNLVRRAA
jgi:hypothetical protein